MRNRLNPGIYDNISNDEYHKLEGISNSGISLILDCPARYYYEKLSGLCNKEKSNELLIGSAIDSRVFEPNLFTKQYTFLPDDFKIKSGKKFEEYEKNENRYIFSRKDYKKILDITDAINNTNIFKNFKNTGKSQQTLIWEDENGVTLRSRPDWMNDDFIVDLKTTRSANPKFFSRSIEEYNYHTQAFMQLEGAYKLDGKKRTHILLAIEKEEPYICEQFILNNDSLEKGRENCLRGAFIYQQCLENAYWPSYGNGESIEISINNFLLKQG
jgi:exodeoxyribonuclease VIII